MKQGKDRECLGLSNCYSYMMVKEELVRSDIQIEEVKDPTVWIPGDRIHQAQGTKLQRSRAGA